MVPLRREWAAVRGQFTALTTAKPSPKNSNAARALIREFLGRLGSVTVLDPACDSGNFLYVTLQKLKDLEKEVIVHAAAYFPFLSRVGPWQLRNIEGNAYAYDLAQMTVWIGPCSGTTATECLWRSDRESRTGVAEAHVQAWTAARDGCDHAVHLDARRAQRAQGLLRARPVPGDPQAPAGRVPPALRDRVHHRLANAVRACDTSMAARRFQRQRLAAHRRWGGKGRGRGSRAPVHDVDAGRTRASAEVRLESGEADQGGDPLGVLPARRGADSPVLRAVAGRLQGCGDPAHSARFPADGGQESRTRWRAAYDGDGDDRSQDRVNPGVTASSIRGCWRWGPRSWRRCSRSSSSRSRT